MRKWSLPFLLAVALPAAAIACASLYGVTDVPTKAEGGAAEASTDGPSMRVDAADRPRRWRRNGRARVPRPLRVAAFLPRRESGDATLSTRMMSSGEYRRRRPLPERGIGLDLDHVCDGPGPVSCVVSVLRVCELQPRSKPGPASDVSVDKALQAVQEAYCVRLRPGPWRRATRDLLLPHQRPQRPHRRRRAASRELLLSTGRCRWTERRGNTDSPRVRRRRLLADSTTRASSRVPFPSTRTPTRM